MIVTYYTIFGIMVNSSKYNVLVDFTSVLTQKWTMHVLVLWWTAPNTMSCLTSHHCWHTNDCCIFKTRQAI